MERIEVELFSDGGNNAVVRMPQRKFPGVVVQGDTLATFWWNVNEALNAARDPGRLNEALDHLEMVVGDLDAALIRYEQALAAHGLTRPYHRPNR
jgi:hypothetical protein